MSRRVITIRGTVQGVGMRPFVYRLAHRWRIRGFVINGGGGVRVEAEGTPSDLDHFTAALRDEAPSASRIEELFWEELPERGEPGFRIEASRAGGEAVRVGPDIATCAECLAELTDPNDRRFGYPFLNCAQCGPRLTIVRGVPYDRQRTTMAGFRMCPRCEAEYHDPADRRFHAQPTACPECGPSLTLWANGEVIAARDEAFAAAVSVLDEGRILAVKGLGGYHLVCDARNDAAVRTLRSRKHREEKPFAVMASDLGQVRVLVEVGDAEAELLKSPRRPIVLLRLRPGAEISPNLSPCGNPYLGVMLPYTPLHHLLTAKVSPLVMTSGNRSDEPIAYRDDEALTHLTGIADAFLTHDRPIQTRCDDGVYKSLGGTPVPIRRSRGDAPTPIALPIECPVPVLAVGGQLKNTFALGSGRHAILSHHLGDLENLEAYRSFVEAVGHYQRLFEITPGVVAHDSHPDYASTRFAAELSGLRKVAVQHHHAHLASCMAEHRLDGEVIGVTFDGTGYGTDGTVWGGEFLVGGYRDFRRAAHLRPVPMPGGDAAAREPWRMAVSHLIDAGINPCDIELGAPMASVKTASRMVERGVNSPMTSSCGRLFDAVAALVGLRTVSTYEGQAAVELEWRAEGVTSPGSYPYAVSGGVIDTRPTIRAIVDDVRGGIVLGLIAARFHHTIAEVIAAVCRAVREETGLGRVVLSGGVFLNGVLTERATYGLTRAGFEVYRHRLVPPGDGGLSLGQIAIAAASVEGRPDAG